METLITQPIIYIPAIVLILIFIAWRIHLMGLKNENEPLYEIEYTIEVTDAIDGKKRVFTHTYVSADKIYPVKMNKYGKVYIDVSFLQKEEIALTCKSFKVLKIKKTRIYE